MIRRFEGSVLHDKAHRVMMEVADIQVDRGDLRGALETCVSPADRNEVMEELGKHQIANGDYDGALKTAEQVNERSAYNLFYDVGEALYEGGERKRLHELAFHMTDRKRAAEFLEAAGLTSRPSVVVGAIQTGPCDISWADALSGKFTEAMELVDQNKCPYYSNIAIKEYASNPVEAERELRKRANRQEVSRGLAEMAQTAAKRGDISNALRLVHAGRQTMGNQNFCLDCIHEIAWAWTLKDKPRVVLGWARSLPIAEQRGFALLGIAQALGHARPK